ncbi:MAG TPA: glutathione peroxidase [Stellaceae bacterium]|jgi:glutathione peroxidase|nr:glutathione peroxidase [Stellaceae bacterium]
MNAYDFTFRKIDGGALALADWRGKPVLVVNTASECGFTPQYKGLEKLWQRYRARGLVLLGVPSNDFGAQEPGSEAEIKEFCTRHYAVDFPLAAKEPVTGAEAHPFYRWVAAEGGAPRWNFHKYLVGPDGTLAGAWSSRVTPDDPAIIAAIESALKR